MPDPIVLLYNQYKEGASKLGKSPVSLGEFAKDYSTNKQELISTLTEKGYISPQKKNPISTASKSASANTNSPSVSPDQIYKDLYNQKLTDIAVQRRLLVQQRQQQSMGQMESYDPNSYVEGKQLQKLEQLNSRLTEPQNKIATKPASVVDNIDTQIAKTLVAPKKEKIEERPIDKANYQAKFTNLVSEDELKKLQIDPYKFDNWYQKENFEDTTSTLFKVKDFFNTGFTDKQEQEAKEKRKQRILNQYLESENERLKNYAYYSESTDKEKLANDYSSMVGSFNKIKELTPELNRIEGNQKLEQSIALQARQKGQIGAIAKQFGENFLSGAINSFDLGGFIDSSIDNISSELGASKSVSSSTDTGLFSYLNNEALYAPQVSTPSFTGKPITYNGKKYLVNEQGQAWDSEEDLFVNNDQLINQLKTLTKDVKETETELSLLETSLQTSTVIGQILGYVVGTKGMGAAKSLRGLTPSVRMGVLGGANASTKTYADTMQVLLDEGASTEEAHDLAARHARNVGVTTGLVSMLASNPSAQKLLDGSIKKSINSIKDSFVKEGYKSTAKKVGGKILKEIEEPFSEAIQELAEYGSETLSARQLNQDYGSKVLEDEMTTDGVVTSALLGATGAGFFSAASNIKLKDRKKTEALSLITLADNYESFLDVSDLMVNDGVLDKTTSDNIQLKVDAYRKHQNKVPDNVNIKDLPNIIELLEQKEQIQRKRDLADDSFKQTFDNQIEEINNQLKTFVNEKLPTQEQGQTNQEKETRTIQEQGQKDEVIQTLDGNLPSRFVSIKQDILDGKSTIQDEIESLQTELESLKTLNDQAGINEVEQIVQLVNGLKSPAQTTNNQNAKESLEEIDDFDALMNGEAEQRRQTGSFERDGITYQRQSNSVTEEQPKGRTTKIKFADNVEEEVEYTLIEADNLQPSHLGGNRNPNFFIPEAQPKNRTDKASITQSDKISDKPNFGELAENNLAYSGAPVVNQYGEVIQGNNRSEGIKKHYKKQGTKYKQDLEENADKFGFTKEQVSSMNNPVLVRVSKANDTKAISLGNLDVKDIETGGKRRIDPVTTTRKIPRTVKQKITDLLFSDNPDQTLNGAIRLKLNPLINIIKDYVNNAQLNSIINKDGEPRPEGIKDLESLINHFIFEDGDVNLPEIFEGLSFKSKEGILKSLPKLLTLSPSKSILKETQNAILAYNDFVKSGVEDFGTWQNQADIFNNNQTPKDKYSELDLKIAVVLLKAETQKEIRLIFNQYSEIANGKEGDMFSEAVEGKSKEVTVNQVFGSNSNNNETTNQPETETRVAQPSDTESERADTKRELGQEIANKPVVAFQRIANFESRKTKDGLSYLSESTSDYNSNQSNLQRSGDKSSTKFNSVKAIWTENKNLQFTGTTRVKNAEDVAQIMSLLENKSVEHAFAIHIDKKGYSHIQFLSIGGITGTVVDPILVLAGVSKFNSNKVYLVHNHPSGNMMPSEADLNITKKIRDGLFPLGVNIEHIIMDTYKKEYVHIDNDNNPSVNRRGELKLKNPLIVNQLTDQEILSEPLGRVRSPDDVFTIIQQFRFSAFPKTAMLVLDQMNNVIGNYVLNKGIDFKEITNKFSETAVGRSVIFYGNQDSTKQINSISEDLRKLDISILDHVVTGSDGKDVADFYKSMGNLGLLKEHQSEYNTNLVNDFQENNNDIRFQKISDEVLTSIKNGDFKQAAKNLKEKISFSKKTIKWGKKQINATFNTKLGVSTEQKEALSGAREIQRSLGREMSVHADQLNFDLQDMFKILSKIKKGVSKQIFEARNELINSYLAGNKTPLSFLNNKEIEYISYLRSRIDKNSTQIQQRLTQTLIAQQNKLEKMDQNNPGYFSVQQSIDKLEATIQKIEANKGNYLHRSYAIFENEDYEPSVEAKQKAIDYFVEEGYSKSEASNLVEKILAEVKESGNAFNFIASNEGSTATNILKKRKTIPKAIRELYGEVSNPVYNFGNTMFQTSKLLASIEYQHKMRNFLLKSGLADFEYDAEKGHTTTFRSKSKSWSLLNDLYLNDFVEEAINDVSGLDPMAQGWAKSYIQLTSWVKYNKTILSPTTMFRNLWSGVFLGMNSGHSFLFAPKATKDAFGQALDMRKKNNKEWRVYRDKLIRLGVLKDGGSSGELNAMLSDFQDNKDFIQENSQNYWRRFKRNAELVYSFGDDFYKVIGYEVEKERLMKAGFSESEAEVESGERIRNTYPTYSYVPKNLQKLRKFPFLGTFVSFPVEAVRTTVNTVNYIYKDIKAGRVELATKRAIGMMVANSTATAISIITKNFFGIGDDEEAALQKTLPEWQNNSLLAYIGKEEGGVSFVDLTAFFPSDVWQRPFRTALKGDDPAKDIYDGIKEALSPFGWDLTTETAIQNFMNQDDYNRDLWDNTKALQDNIINVTDFNMKKLAPGMYMNVRELARANEIAPIYFGSNTTGGKTYTNESAMLAFFGFRNTVIDFEQSIKYGAYDTVELRNKLISNLKNNLKKEIKTDNIVGDVKTYHGEYLTLFENISNQISMARTLGLKENQIRQIFKGKVNTTQMSELLRGETPNVPNISSTSISKLRDVKTEPRERKRLEKNIEQYEKTLKELNRKK